MRRDAVARRLFGRRRGCVPSEPKNNLPAPAELRTRAARPRLLPEPLLDVINDCTASQLGRRTTFEEG